MAEGKKYLDPSGVSYLKDKIFEYIKDYIDTEVSEVVLQYQSIYNFPNIGDEHKIYIDISKNQAYRWDDDSIKYFCIGSDYNDIEVIDGGSSK